MRQHYPAGMECILNVDNDVETLLPLALRLKGHAYSVIEAPCAACMATRKRGDF